MRSLLTSDHGKHQRFSASTSHIDAEALAQVGLFADLTPDELRELASCLRPRRYARDEVVFLRGDPGTAFYVVASGRIRITLSSPDGKELILGRIAPGGYFGELALLDSEPRSADAVASAPSVLLILERDTFRQLLARHTSMADKILATMSRYVRSNTSLIQDAAFLDGPARLARVLLDLASAPGATSLPPAGSVVPERMKQGELGALVGASRESVNKWLGAFERQGLIRVDRGQITLLDPPGLRRRIY